MKLDGTITIIVPEELIDAASLLMQAFDPDVGGYDSFLPVTEDGLFCCSMPASAELETLFNDLKDKPAKLTNFVQEQQDLRFAVSGEEVAAVSKDPARAKRRARFRRADAEALIAAWVVDNRDLRRMQKELGLNLTPRVKLERGAEIKA